MPTAAYPSIKLFAGEHLPGRWDGMEKEGEPLRIAESVAVDPFGRTYSERTPPPSLPCSAPSPFSPTAKLHS